MPDCWPEIWQLFSSGRYVEIHIYPLSFNEYLAFAESNEEEKSLSIQENFANYLRYGGLPESMR